MDDRRVMDEQLSTRGLRELEDALTASEQRYRELFEEETSGRFVASPDGRLVDANAKLASMLGYGAASGLIGRTATHLASEPAALQKLLSIVLAGHHADAAELQLVRADGTSIDVHCSIAGSMDTNGRLVAIRAQLTETTATKELETRLRGAERMEAIGRLAGGLAHDFNNLLMVIGGNTERLLAEMPESEPLKGAATAIRDAAARVASLTRQLLAYSRRQIFELEPLALSRLVVSARPRLESILGERIALSLTVAADVPPISADARQVEYVLVNLVNNAAEAMPGGGTLAITVDTLDIGEHAPVERRWLRPGRYVRLSVADSGLGMDAVTKAYAFQPFFTTKKMGDGRGLGLSTVYGIVKQSHGFVWVDSAPGQGATFTLLFPALRADGHPVGHAGKPVATETILVVDADVDGRQHTCEALRRRGYRVLDAGSDTEALQVFASHGDRIHLLISAHGSSPGADVFLAHRLKAIDPMLQSLAIVDSPDGSARPRALPPSPSIQRPFTLVALADKVREVLDSGEGR
jgi:PAS domain S-box-containing protein